MLNQFKYSSRLWLNQRMTALGITLVLNILFAIAGASGLLGNAGKVTAVVISSLALCALYIVCVIADFESIRNLFSAPAGYGVMLTPVPGRKILLGRALPIVVFDLVSIAVGIAGIVAQAYILGSDYLSPEQLNVNGQPGWGVFTIALQYLYAVMLIFFGCAMAKSFYYRLPARGVLGVLTVFAVMYLFSWLDLALFPVADVSRFGLFFSVEIIAGWNAGMIGYVFISALRIAALYLVTAYLLDRRVNI